MMFIHDVKFDTNDDPILQKPLNVIIEVYADIQLPSMIKSASKTQSYLGVVDDSWLEFWRIRSYLV